MDRLLALLCGTAAVIAAVSSCNKNPIGTQTPDIPPEWLEEETYAGGLLGTTFNVSASAFEDPTPAVENAGLVGLHDVLGQ